MATEMPMETGRVVAVTLKTGEAVNYIRGAHGTWYPIATGVHPYLGSHALRAHEFEVVGW